MREEIEQVFGGTSMYRADDGYYVPVHMLPGLKRFILNGVKPGDFLYAVLCSNLKEAVGRADSENKRNLSAYMELLYNYAPATCWSSKEKVDAWIDQGGLDGR